MRGKPGDRRARWKQSCGTEAVIYLAGGIFFLVLAAGPGAWILAGVSFLGALLAFQDFHRGWKISYELPPRGAAAMASGGLRGEIAREAWEAVQREAQNPDRQRYSFQRKHK